ncbi:hypothetical protein Tco_0665196 [Tanacetum coccineum]
MTRIQNFIVSYDENEVLSKEQSCLHHTSVYSDSEPWRFQWVSDEEPKAPEEAPQSPRQAPPSLDYVHGLEHPPSSYYVSGPKYPNYVAPSDDEVPIKDQPLPADALPTALSSDYIVDSDPKEDPDEDLEDDPEDDPADYPTDRGDEEEEEFSGDDETEPFKTDESAPIPPSHRLRRAGISVRLSPPMAASMEAHIAEYAATLTPPSPPPSPLTPLSSALPQIPSPLLPLPSPPT